MEKVILFFYVISEANILSVPARDSEFFEAKFICLRRIQPGLLRAFQNPPNRGTDQ